MHKPRFKHRLSLILNQPSQALIAQCLAQLGVSLPSSSVDHLPRDVDRGCPTVEWKVPVEIPELLLQEEIKDIVIL